MQLPVVQSGYNFMEYDSQWNLVQNNIIIQPASGAIGTCHLFLPDSLTFRGFENFQIIVQITAISDPVFIHTQNSDTLMKGSFIQCVEAGVEYVFTPTGTGDWQLECPFSNRFVKVKTLSTFDLISPAYIGAPVGQEISVIDYNSTRESCIIRKITSRFNNEFDWIVVSTTDKTATGTIGTIPI